MHSNELIQWLRNKIEAARQLKALGQWEYGTAGRYNKPARRHKLRGNVQFVMWKAGEQGHKEDYWIDYHPFWWPTFKLDSES